MTAADEPQPYAFTDETPVAPPLPGEAVASRTLDDLYDRVAADLVAQAVRCVRRFGDFHVALTGAAQLEPLYLRLMYDPNFRVLPWRRTHLWIVVDGGGFGSVAETIIAHAGIPDDQVHPIDMDTQDAYESSIREVLAWRERGHDRIDYALVLLDADGAFAGLGPIARPLPMLNACRTVAVVAHGADVADVVRGLASCHAVSPEVLAAGLAPHQGDLKWYVDAAACGEEPE